MRIFCFILLLQIHWINGFLLPNSSFFVDVMHKFSRLYMVFHLEGNKEDVQVLRKSLLTSEFPVQLFIEDITKTRPEDVHFYEIKENKLKHLEDLFQLRKPTNKELWLMDITSLKTIENAKENLARLRLDLNDDVVWFKTFNESAIHIWEVYKISEESQLQVIDLGSWTNSSGIVFREHEEKWQRRKDLQGFHFKTATQESKPYIFSMTPTKNGFEISGIFAEVFQNLQEILNFTYSVQKPPDGEWGALKEDGTWTGMVGMLYKKEIDIAITDFTVTVERSEVITFCQPITEIYHTFFIKNPTESFNFEAYTEPLDKYSWMITFILAFFLPFFMFLTTRTETMLSNKREFSLPKSLYFTLGSLTMKGWSHTPSNIGAKIVFISILFFGVLVYWHWEAMLISYLATWYVALPFKDIPELLGKTNFRVATAPGSSYSEAFRLSNDSDWKTIWNERIQPYLEEYKPVAINDNWLEYIVSEPETALYYNYFSIITFQKFIDCEVVAIPAKYDMKPFAYGFQKDSPYLDIFNHYLKDMIERGSLNQIKQKYQGKQQVCPDNSGKPLGLNKCVTAFIIFIIGLIASLASLGIELLAKSLNWSIFDIKDFDDTESEILLLKKMVKVQSQALHSLQTRIKALQKIHASKRPKNDNEAWK